MTRAAELHQFACETKRNQTASNRLRISIKDSYGYFLGWLECVDEGMLTSSDVTEAMTRWRRRAKRNFLTQFEPSVPGTVRWLRETVIPAADRLLFIISTSNGERIGHIGISHLTAEGAELDNLIRGEHGGHAKLIFFAEVSLLGWLFGAVGIDHAFLHVLSNNVKTIALHESVGFVERSREQLFESRNDAVLTLSTESKGKPVSICYVRMGLTRTAYSDRYSRHLERCVGSSCVLSTSFEDQSRWNASHSATDKRVVNAAADFLVSSAPHRYSYGFKWMGRPIIQLPQDIVAMQEIIWDVKPDCIVETGVAHGGSLVFYASMLEFLGRGDVIGIEVDLRIHNRIAIESHPMARRIRLVDGSSIDPVVFAAVRQACDRKEKIMVVLDSNHTHDHVLAELSLYSQLVSLGSYCVVMDTVVENLPSDFYLDRPWAVGDNPRTAVHDFLSRDSRFVCDDSIPAKLGITVSPGGYLRRVA